MLQKFHAYLGYETSSKIALSCHIERKFAYGIAIETLFRKILRLATFWATKKSMGLFLWAT